MRTGLREGRLTEAPACAATGVDRRAFGEFVSSRGELASYAFGWVTGTEHRHASLTVGLGAGNPGGGTFHAIMTDRGDNYAFSLVDEPFENVPEGGPHLTAAQAREHECMPFVWWVADFVMEQDRRAWWMRHWLMETHCRQTPQVLDRGEPVLKVVRAAAGEPWQMSGATGIDDTARLAHIHHAVDGDSTLMDVLDLEPGQMAVRRSATARWKRRRL